MKKLLKNTRGTSLFELGVLLLLMVLFTILVVKTISDLGQGQRPWTAIVVGGSLFSLIVTSVAWHYHKRLVLHLAKKRDPELARKLVRFQADATMALSKEITVEEWSEPKVEVFLSFRRFRHYKIGVRNSSVYFSQSYRGLNETDQAEMSVVLNQLSLQTFGRVNHWLVRYWFSLEGMSIKSESLSMHKVMALNAQRLNLLQAASGKNGLAHSKA